MALGSPHRGNRAGEFDRRGTAMKFHGRKSNIKKKRVSGYLKRKSTKTGRNILKRRRRRGRTPTSL